MVVAVAQLSQLCWDNAVWKQFSNSDSYAKALELSGLQFL